MTTSTNFIQELDKVYSLRKCKAEYNRLYLYVRSSVYTQYLEICMQVATSRQKNHVAKKLCNMYFFIDFNCKYDKYGVRKNARSRTCKLSDNIIENAIHSRNSNQISLYKQALKNVSLIDYNSYGENMTRYTINIPSKGMNFNSRSFIEIEYCLSNESTLYYQSTIKNTVKYITSISSTYSYPPNNISLSSSNASVDIPTTCTLICTNVETPREFTSELFKNRYSRLSYDELPDVHDKDFIFAMKLINEHVPAEIKDDGRYYHSFHNISAENRKHILFDNEHIVESFDVHNCNYCLLWAALDDTVPELENNRFYNFVLSGKLYDDIAEYVNKNETWEGGRHWDREWSKEQCLGYLNSRNCDITQGRRFINEKTFYKVSKNGIQYRANGYYHAWVDKYIEDFFPNVRNFIYLIKAKKSSRHKSYALHYLLAPIETKTIVFGVIAELYEKYGIEALSLHDGIYLKESDAKYLKDNNISAEELFKEYLLISKL